MINNSSWIHDPDCTMTCKGCGTNNQWMKQYKMTDHEDVEIYYWGVFGTAPTTPTSAQPGP